MPYYPSIGNPFPKINVSEQADGTLILDAGNYALDQITKPAMLLRDLLVDSLSVSFTHGAVAVSEHQAAHSRMLIDFLVASAHTASAEALMKRYGNGSWTQLLKRGSSGRKFKDPAVRRQALGFGEAPVYLEKKDVTVDTRIGSVEATIVSARTRAGSTTLVFTFEYAGDPGLGLSPFAVHFMSHALHTAPPLSEWQPGSAENLDDITALLENEDVVVQNDTIFASIQQPALPLGILAAVAARLDDEYDCIRGAAIYALGKQPALPDEILASVAARMDDKHSYLAQNFSKVEAVWGGGADGYVLWANVEESRMRPSLLHDILTEVAGVIDEEENSARLDAAETSGQLAWVLNEILEDVAARKVGEDGCVICSAGLPYFRLRYGRMVGPRVSWPLEWDSGRALLEPSGRLVLGLRV